MDLATFYNQWKDSDEWLLIQLPELGYKSEIIHSSDVIQKEEIQNGKTVDVKYGHSLLKADIYTTSDNKKFLEREMYLLNSAKAEESLNKTNFSVSGLPSPTWSNNTYESMISNVENESTIVNNTNESMISNVENESVVVMEPRTFEQGTETDIKLLLTKLAQQFESFNQQTQKNMFGNRQTLKIMCDKLNMMCEKQKTMCDDIKKIKQKLNIDSHSNPHIINPQTILNSKPIVLSKIIKRKANNEPTKSSNHIANLNTTQINNNVSDVNNANVSHSLSTQNNGASDNVVATNELTLNSFPIYQGHESFSAGKENHTKSSFRSNAEHSETVKIGVNGTEVPKIALDIINGSWSYSYATRKLLSKLFTREVLASHSLSGRKPPAHSSKPTKKQLNTLVVADIVQHITKVFGVIEEDVRAVITIKCYVEAKMLERKIRRRENSNNVDAKAGS